MMSKCVIKLGLFTGVWLAGQANLALNATSEKPLHALFL
jgi:hypothetical protein